MRRRSGPALWQDLARAVDTIAPLQHINHVLGKPGVADRTGAPTFINSVRTAWN